MEETELATDQGNAGYVYAAFSSGIFSLRKSFQLLYLTGISLLLIQYDFSNYLKNVVRQGGHANANGCFAGALMGCLLGFRGLPTEQMVQLRNIGWLLSKAEGFCRVAGACRMPYVYPIRVNEDGPNGGKTLRSLKELAAWKRGISRDIREQERKFILRNPFNRARCGKTAYEKSVWVKRWQKL